MSRREKKDKKVLLIILLLLLSIAIIVGTAFAFFSDYVTTGFSGTTGTIKLDKGTETKLQYFTRGGTEESKPFTTSIGNLNPGDIVDAGFSVTNKGNKSAHIRDKITVTVSVSDPSDMPSDITDKLIVYSYDSANEAAQRSDIRNGNDSAYTKMTLTKNNTLSTTTSFVYEYELATPSIMDGVGTDPETEAGGISSFNARYLLYFNKAAGNEYQKLSISYGIRVEAMQYRNNTTPNWTEVAASTVTIP